MSRLPRWQPMNDPTTVPRMPSPRVGSTLMTSAPRSASSIGPKGPARYWPKSITRMPSSGPGISDHAPGPKGGYLGLVVARRSEHLLGVGTGRRLRPLHLARACASRKIVTPSWVVGPTSGSSTCTTPPVSLSWG